MTSEPQGSIDAPINSRRVALKRWHMLAQVLKGQSCTEIVDTTVSVRRFQSFQLLNTKQIELKGTETNDHGNWYLYTSQELPEFSMQIRHLDGTMTPERLNGFNNTGNVCVWPSEEVMTFYCMQHLDDFRGHSVCELGGGMTCLAGVALGIYSEALQVDLTDGNEDSVQNLQSIIDNNNFGTTTVATRLLRWGCEKMHSELLSSYDTVICADCLFFDDGREYLAEMIFDVLKEGGQALLFAPSRNETFHKFADVAQKYFQVAIVKEYDKKVWNLHQKLQTECAESYEESLHYPILMKLTKPLSSSRDVTPESR